RVIYAFPDVIEWLEEILPALEPILDENRQSPLEQMDALLYEFISGEDFSFHYKAKILRPSDKGIWELKTKDIRVFGWFARKCVFIAGQIESAYKCKKHDLYTGHQSMCLHKIKTTGFPILLGEVHDVL